MKWRLLRYTNAYTAKSGGREPPVVRLRACSGNRKSPADAHSHNTRAGGVSPRGSVTRTACWKNRAPFSDMRPTAKSGGVSPPWFAEARSQCHRPVTRNTTDGRPANAIAITFAGTPGTVPCMFGVSPLQMRFRTPRRADTRRSCLQARTCAGEMTTFAMHKRMYSQERGRQPPVVGLRACSGNRKSPAGVHSCNTRTEGVSPPWLSITYARWRPSAQRRQSPWARPCDGLRIARELTSSPDFSRAGETMRWIADYGRLAWRISPRLARPCNGFRIARELTSSTDFSTAGETMRWIAEYGRLARRISPRLARPCDGLRPAGQATASPDFSTAGETGRLIAEGTLAGIMAINGSSVPTVSASAGWAETLRMALTACQERLCRACRQVPAGRRRRGWRGRCPSQERARPVGKCRLGGDAEDEADRVPGTSAPASAGWAVSTVAKVACDMALA